MRGPTTIARTIASKIATRTGSRTGTVFINGKFLEHPITGTERYALEVTRRILTRRAAGHRPAVLLLPQGVSVPDGVDPGQCRTLARSGIAFEQISLPIATRGSMLLNLGGPAPLAKRRQLVVMHDATPFRRLGTFSWMFVAWYWLMYAILTRTARHLVTVSQFSADELSSVFRVPASRFTIAPCSADHMAAHGDGVRPPTLPDGVSRYALILGTLAQHKNVLPVARAIAGSGAELVIAGSIGKSSVYSAASAAHDQADLPSTVHLVGRVPDEAIVWLYRHASVFVVPSLYEGFGIPLIEAQLCGCPVVSSDAASLPEVGASSVLYFDPRQPAQAAGLVHQVADLSEAQRSDVVARSLLNAQRFSWDATAQTILTVSTGTPATDDASGTADHARPAPAAGAVPAAPSTPAASHQRTTRTTMRTNQEG